MKENSLKKSFHISKSFAYFAIIFLLSIGFSLAPFSVQKAHAAFPTIAGSSTIYFSSTGNPQVITLPSGIVTGDLLLVVYQPAGGSTASTPTGWTLLASSTNATYYSYVFYLIATSSVASTLPIPMSGYVRATAVSYRISVNTFSGTPEIKYAAGSTSSPALSPSWGSADNLWIAGLTNVYSGKTTAAPTNYSGFMSVGPGTASVAYSEIGTAYRNYTSSSDTPGLWTTTGSFTGPNALTIVVKPVVTATVPGVPTFYDSDGTNQITFDNIRMSTTTPLFSLSATSSSDFDTFQLRMSTTSDFSGTVYTQTFSGTYASTTQYNLYATNISPSLPTTASTTYYVGARVA